MLSKVLTKFMIINEHHQVIAGAMVTFAVVCFSWGIHNLLERFMFPNKRVYGYMIAIILGFIFLWTTKQYILFVT